MSEKLVTLFFNKIKSYVQECHFFRFFRSFVFISDPTCASLLPSVSVPVESLRLGTERRARDAVVMGNVNSRFRGPA